MTHAIAPSRAVAHGADLQDRAVACEHRQLADRIRQCVPPHHPAFGKLLQLVSIEVSEAVPTAAVTIGARSRLLVHPGFVAARCRTDAHLSMLVMHELYHVLLGHTRLYRRATPEANWAFDCIINAQLCRMHPQLEFTSFFAAGAAPEGPWSLIGPPPGWPASPRYASGALGDVHRRLYDDDGATTVELFALLERTATTLDADGAGRLIGNHADEPRDGDPLHADHELLAETRRIVARWPMVERRGGADDGGTSGRLCSALRRHADARRAVRALLRAAAFGNDGGPRKHVPVETEAVTPLPQAHDRRAQLQRLLGTPPLLWQGPMFHHAPRESGQVSVYVDVSGSMAAWLPVLLEALVESAALLRWPVLGFSTEVHPLTRTELGNGELRSTGGTHFACVAQHLVESRARRAVVITDGDVQEIPAALEEQLRRTRPRVHVGLLDGCDGSFCARLGWPVTRLPPLDKVRA